MVNPAVVPIRAALKLSGVKSAGGAVTWLSMAWTMPGAVETGGSVAVDAGGVASSVAGAVPDGVVGASPDGFAGAVAEMFLLNSPCKNR